MNEEFAHYSLDAVVMTAMPFLELQSVLQKLIEVHCYGVGIAVTAY